MNSITGYVITVPDCNVLWQSKVQSETAMSTMEVEMIGLVHTCRELLPIMDVVATLGEAVGLPKDQTTMNASIHEDIAVALT